jgi:hypothetical protein
MYQLFRDDKLWKLKNTNFITTYKLTTDEYINHCCPYCKEKLETIININQLTP